MAKCAVCRREQKLADTCKAVPKTLKGVTYMPVRFGVEPYWNKAERAEYQPTKADRCFDCGVEYGGYHHTGCPEEACPKCGEEMLSSDCQCGW